MLQFRGVLSQADLPIVVIKSAQGVDERVGIEKKDAIDRPLLPTLEPNRAKYPLELPTSSRFRPLHRSIAIE